MNIFKIAFCVVLLVLASSAWAQYRPGVANPQPVDASAGGTPTGASTSANQATEISKIQDLINQAVTLPIPITESFTGGTVTAGGTFQSVLVAAAGRKGCAIINNGVNAGRVFAGATSGSHNNYWPIAAGQTWYCAISTLTVETQNIDYTSTTTGDAFIVVSW